MNVEITDSSALRRLPPSGIAAYLRSKKAILAGDYAGKAAIWHYGGEELLAPFSTRYADYGQLVSRLLKAISAIESRPETQIFTDMLNSGFDIIRIRVQSESTRSGSLNLERGVTLIVQSRNMLLAAACSAATGKISYPGQKPKIAETFMQSLRLGQTERGSFIIQILAPVSVQLKDQGVLIDLPEEDSYDRRVVPTLKSGLEAIMEASALVNLDKEITHFTSRAKSGLSTNLCDALVAIYEALEPEALDVAIDFSSNRSSPPPSAKIKVDMDYMPLAREISEAIKNREPEEGYLSKARGPIIELLSENPRDGGQIIMRDLMTTKPRKLKLSLDGEEYIKAVDAHKKKLFVEVSGAELKSRPGATPILSDISSINFFDPAA